MRNIFDTTVVFEEEPNVIDTAIALCEAGLRVDRTDFIAYETLENVYQAKIDLLTIIPRV